ncbi:MAG: hypothetical protein PWP31_1803 [Clostridia bacterium]|nr:hypothetical protein [Clostridia bacterium]
MPSRKNLNVRMTVEEYKRAENKAKELGISLSGYIRMLINKDTKKTEIA